MVEAQIRRIIQEQKQLGKTPNEIFKYANESKINIDQLNSLLLEFYSDYEFCNSKNEFRQLASSNQNFWDPLGEIIDLNSFDSKKTSIRDKIKVLSASPEKLKRSARLAFLLGLLNPILLGLALSYWGWADFVRNLDFLVLSLLLWVPYIWHCRDIKSDEIDLVQMLIAENNHWVYNPELRTEKGAFLSEKFPLLFPIGDKYQGVEDEFWGTFYSDEISHDFYAATYSYSKKHTNSDSETYQTIFETAIGIRLEKKLKTSLLLLPELNSSFWNNNLDDALSNLFLDGDKDVIKVESTQFNEAFKVYKDGEIDNQQLISIFKRLSPNTQILLVKLLKYFPGCKVYFVDDVFWFSKKGFLFPDKPGHKKLGYKHVQLYTDFLKSFEIDSRDQDYLQQQFDSIFQIGSNIAKHLK